MDQLELDQLELGPVRTGPVRPGSLRTGPVRPGSVRPLPSTDLPQTCHGLSEIKSPDIPIVFLAVSALTESSPRLGVPLKSPI